MSDLERIELFELGRPLRLPDGLPFVAGFWVISNRTPLSHEWAVRAEVRRASDVCRRFKDGEAALASQLVDGMVAQVIEGGWALDPDVRVVPVPLSPDKLRRGDLDRAGVLARGVADSLGLEVCAALSLSAPISKRALKNAEAPGRRFSRGEFERRYAGLLRAAPIDGRVLLVDDVCSHGSTLRTAAEALSGCGVVGAVTAGQVALKHVVLDPDALLDEHPDIPLGEDEAVYILEGIARSAASAGARIAAIKQLRKRRAE